MNKTSRKTGAFFSTSQINKPKTTNNNNRKPKQKKQQLANAVPGYKKDI